jgi:hypothetical protein
MLNDDIDILSKQVHRLVIENRLLRAASEEQRKLNGELRVTIKEQLENSAPFSSIYNGHIHLAIESLRKMMFKKETI